MDVIKTAFQDLVIIKPAVFHDDRGSFHESFNAAAFHKNVQETTFIQDNISVSKKNVLRGLHLQLPPFAQAKLVSVLQGSAIDVVVDLRKSQPTYGQSYSIELSKENKTQLFIPRGFAHGFVSLEDDTIFSYKVDNKYDKASELTLPWNDNDFGIEWPVESPLLSDKDVNDAIPFSKFDSPFS